MNPLNSYQSDSQRWQAVCSRDADADEKFVYAVLSTGIVCYPSCPSRAALAKNVRYFTQVTDALSEGFRHCKRCRTDLPPLAVRNRLQVVDACRLIDNAQSAVRIDVLSESLGISRFHLQKLFKQYIGLSPKAYVQAVRAVKLQHTLSTDSTITQAVLDAGYESLGSFYSDVQKRLGMSATTRRRGSRDMPIRYAFADSALGLIVVAKTDAGVCAVLFGESRKALIDELTARFPKAKLVAEPQALQNEMQAVVEKIAMPRSARKIPLDIQGTAFQEKVWSALCQIESGSTASYSDVAKAIGQPGAARAVARACAGNPLAVLVPCHRVVRADGGMSGYRWGVERKRALLDNESS